MHPEKKQRSQTILFEVISVSFVFEHFCRLEPEIAVIKWTLGWYSFSYSRNYFFSIFILFILFSVPLMEEAVITIRPKLTTTSQGLRKYDANHRKCFLESERQLRFYKIYTQNNCYEECVANYTAKECGCVKFSQPSKSIFDLWTDFHSMTTSLNSIESIEHNAGDRETPVCGVAKILCHLMAETRLILDLVAGNELARAYYEACNCLPSCTSIEYNPVIDRVEFDKAAITSTSGRHANMSGWEFIHFLCAQLLRYSNVRSLTFHFSIQVSKLVILFESPFLDTEHRQELYTITDLLSICGGLFGLFMGISALSVIEILYYSTLRWYWILRRPVSERNWLFVARNNEIWSLGRKILHLCYKVMLT